MPDEYNVTVYDDDGQPLAAVTATALTDNGNEIVQRVRETVEPGGET